MDLDPDLLRAAKQRAAERHMTLSAVVEEALREAAARREQQARAARVNPTTDRSRGGLRSGVDLDDNVAVRDLMDTVDDPL